MSTTASLHDRGITRGRTELGNPSYQAFQLLRLGFIVAPILAGLDKFANVLTHWDKYLAPIVPQTLHVSSHAFMLFVGVTEILAGLLVAVKPKVGAYVVAAWLLGIIVNLMIVGGYLDVALRDLGLCLGALALGRLSQLHAA